MPLTESGASSSEWILAWLSPERWNKYLTACDGDTAKALALYEWNIEFSQAVMHDIAHIEVAIRNVYDQALSIRWQGSEHWLFDQASPVNAQLLRRRRSRTVDSNERNRASITEAVRRVHSPQPAPGQAIAELSFGFWRHLSDAAHEKTLWIPYLSWAFSPKADRKQLERTLGLVNRVRNRASHHEPLFDIHRVAEVKRAHASIQELAYRLLPPLAEHLRATSTILSVIERKPN